jgi:sporulation-control protein spo0M
MLSLLKKPRVDVTLDTNGGRFYPSDAVNLGIRVAPQESCALRSASVELKCVEVYWIVVSDGKTTRQQKAKRTLTKLAEEFLGSTELTSGMSVTKSVSLSLPADIPPTITGKTVNISWHLDVKLDVKKKRDLHERGLLTVLPVPTGIPVTEGTRNIPQRKVTAASGDGSLVITLDPEYGTPGKTLRCKLEATLEKDVSCTQIRAELEVKESAGTRSSKTVADMVMLEENSTLADGTSRQWTFELTFPDSAPSSVAVSSSKVEWQVKGIIAKSTKKDFSVSYPIRVS